MSKVNLNRAKRAKFLAVARAIETYASELDTYADDYSTADTDVLVELLASVQAEAQYGIQFVETLTVKLPENE